MNHKRFDDLARSYASGMSRRQMLKGLVAGAVGALLARFGYNQYVGATLASSPNQAVFLPLILTPSCPTPSVCGKRQYCSADQTCLCLRSAEGDLRCGKIPSTCNVKLCQTSTDCAELGEGYFCDTPNSGCCSDPPQELQRCIAPCVPPCPSERVCGATCCPQGQRCISGACAAPSFCENDPVTPESLEAAAAAIAGGATDVAISPNGCRRYRRTLKDGKPATEEMTLNGLTTLKWEHTATLSTGRFDIDLDGFFEQQIDLEYDETLADTISKQLQYNPVTRLITRRETVRPLDAQTRRVVWEEVGQDQVLRVIADFVVSIGNEYYFDQSTPATTASNTIEDLPTPCGAAEPGHGTCTIAELATILNRVREGVKEGTECLERYGRGDLARKMLDVTVTNRFSVFCKDIGSEGYVACLDDRFLPKKPAVIHVNRDRYFGPEGTPTNQRAAMFHELLHLDAIFGGHPGNIGNYTQYDPVRACERLCFQPEWSNQCHCATCAHAKSQAKTCDERCKQYKACNSGPNQCGDKCCVGPCEGQGCCPPERICNKLQTETAICCPADQQCYDKDSKDPGKGSICCKPSQVCPPKEGSDRKCCPDGTTCVEKSPGVFSCEPQRVYCNCNQTCYTDVNVCLSECKVSLGCFTGICGPAEPGQCQ